MRDAWIRELREDKQIEVKYVPAREQKADILTKGLDNYKFRLGLRLTRGLSHAKHMHEVVGLAHVGAGS